MKTSLKIAAMLASPFIGAGLGLTPLFSQSPTPQETVATTLSPPFAVAIVGTWTASSGGSSGYVTASSNPINIATVQPRSGLSISCTDDACQVHIGGSIDDAKALLEKIANRSMRMEVTIHDAACHVQRETIEPKPKQDLVAAVQ